MINNQIIPGIVYPEGNGYVSTLKPTISGTGAPGAVISGKIDSMPFTSPVSDNGTWSVTCGTQLTDKTEHIVVLSQTNKNGDVSPQVTARFRTDTGLLTPHTVTFPNNNQLLNTNAPVLTGTGKPGAVITAKLGKADYTTAVGADGTWHFCAEALPEGLIHACVGQRDLGNFSPDIHLSFTVDTVAPGEPILDEPADNGFTKCTQPVIRGRGEPNAVIDAVVDDKKYAAMVGAQGIWSIEIAETLVDDIHIISARQKDQAGNQSPEKITLFTVKSKQPPVPVIERPKTGGFTSSASPVISGWGERDCVIEAHLGERMFSSTVDNSGAWAIKIPLILPEGPTTIKFYQIDRAGNVSRNVDLSLFVDTRAPLPPTVIYPEKDGYVVSPDFVVKGTGEPESLIECALGNSQYRTHVQNDGSWQIDVRGNDTVKYAMEYALSARQIDLAGNQSPCTKVSFMLDQTRLSEPELTYPKNAASINTLTPVLTGIGKAGATLQLNIKNEMVTATVSPDSTWTLILPKPLCEGENIVNLCQTDTGNTSPVKTVRFHVDLTAPQPPTIISPAENQILGGVLVLSGSGENKAAVTVRLDDKCYTAVVRNGTWVVPVTDGVQNGIHSVLASQTDEAGNKSRCASVNFLYYSENQSETGVTGPVTYQILYNPPGPEWAAETIVTLKTDGPLSVNNICGTIFSAVVRKNGIFSFEYLDANGCQGSVSAAITWIDNNAPVVLVQSGENAFSSEKTVQYFKPCGSGISSALINGAPFESGRVVSEEGAYQVEVRDQTGNIAFEQFIIDRTVPNIAGVEKGRVYGTDVTLKFTDSLSGIKSALLNGSNILSGCCLTTNGDYNLIVTDYGGNAAELNFSIRK